MSKTSTGSAAARLIMSKRVASTSPLHTTQLVEVANIKAASLSEHPSVPPSLTLGASEVKTPNGEPTGLTVEVPRPFLPVEGPGQNPHEEELLAGKILELWSNQSKKAASVKRTRAELAKLQAELAENLYHLKKRYCRAGRDGEWSSFLKGNGIPRTSADRYVSRHEKSITSHSASCPSGASGEPTADDVSKLVQKLMPKLTTLLVTPALAEHFVGEIIAATRHLRGKLD
jgi:hypothetical protein